MSLSGANGEASPTVLGIENHLKPMPVETRCVRIQLTASECLIHSVRHVCRCQAPRSKLGKSDAVQKFGCVIPMSLDLPFRIRADEHGISFD